VANNFVFLQTTRDRQQHDSEIGIDSTYACHRLKGRTTTEALQLLTEPDQSLVNPDTKLAKFPRRRPNNSQAPTVRSVHARLRAGQVLDNDQPTALQDGASTTDAHVS